MRVRYQGPFDFVAVPEAGKVAGRGVPVDLPDGLVLSPEVWEPVDLDGMTVAELRTELEAAGVEPPKGATKSELIALITEPDSGTESEEDAS